MQWWDKKYGKESICAITHNRLRPGKNKKGYPRSVFLECKHGFNRKALENWVLKSGKSTCPLCRKYFTIKL